MAVLNREDYKTAIPQLGKEIKESSVKISDLYKTKVSKSGDTINGKLTLHADTTIAQNDPSELIFSVHQADNDVTTSGFIRVYDDHDAYNYGTNMVIQGNGNMIVGAGEAPTNLYNADLQNSTGENIYLASDGAINFDVYFATNNRQRVVLGQSRNFYPENAGTGVGSIGTASNHWANSYLNYIHVGAIGSLNGYAPTTWVDLKNNPGTPSQSEYNVDNLTNASSDEAWIKSALKAICAKYPSVTEILFRGFLHPNSRGYFEVFIYDTSDLASNGLPACFGTWRRYDTKLYEFHNTSGAVWAFRDLGAIGTVKNAYPSSAVSVPNNTGKSLCSLSLEAGVWIIDCGVRCPTNNNGVRWANVSTTNGSTDNNINTYPTQGSTTQMKFTKVVVPSATTTYYLNVVQTSGSTLSYPVGGADFANFMRAVRIK